MAVRLLVCACLFVGGSAHAVNSKLQFKTIYGTYVVNKDASEVKITNANIVGLATPPAGEKEMQRWYHETGAAEQAEAKAIMDKAYVAKPAVLSTASSCLSDITAAQNKVPAQAANPTWPVQYKVYNKLLAEKVGKDGEDGWNAEEVKAWSCLDALGTAEKEMVIKTGLRAKLFGIFKKKAGDDALTAADDITKVSTFVSGTLAAAPPTGADKGANSQPMYSQADAALRLEMMQYMVTFLNLQAPALV